MKYQWNCCQELYRETMDDKERTEREGGREGYALLEVSHFGEFVRFTNR
jgi:hypothetical protein